MIGSIFFGILVALSIVLLIFVLGMWANWFSIQAQKDVFSFSALCMEPDGVEEHIETGDGTQIRALHKGSGPPVVLIHDAGLSVVSMNLMWKLLAGAGFRVITYDQRGHGKSTVGTAGMGIEQLQKDLHSVLEYFNLYNAILVGHSTGAFLTIRYLLQYKDFATNRVRGVVSVAGFAGNILEGAQQNRFSRGLIQTGLLGHLIRNRLFGFGWAAAVFGAGASPSRVRAWLKLMREKPLQRLLPVLDAQIQENYYDRLGEIQTPYVVTVGQADRRLSPFHSERLAAGIPNARLEWVDDAGNMMLWECPAKLVEMVRSLAK